MFLWFVRAHPPQKPFGIACRIEARTKRRVFRSHHDGRARRFGSCMMLIGIVDHDVDELFDIRPLIAFGLGPYIERAFAEMQLPVNETSL